MINLLPTETKVQIRAAKLNTVLINYIVILGFGIGFLALVFAGAYFILTDAKSRAEQITADNNQKAAIYNDTKLQAEQLQTNLINARALLDNDTNYAHLLTAVAALTPQGVIVDKLTLGPDVFTTPTRIQVYAKTIDLGLSFRDALQSSPLVSSVTTGPTASQGGIDNYPATVELSLIFSRGAAL